MKDFFKSLVASLVALILFAGVAFILLLGLLAALGPSVPVVPKRAVLVFDLDRSIPDSMQEVGAGEAVQRALAGDGSEVTPMRTLIQALDRASQDTNISALYLTGNLRPSGYSNGPAALKELREAIARFKEKSGKPIIAYNQMWAKRDLYLCAGASKVYMNPAGAMDMTGLLAEPMFFVGALKKYGVDVQVGRVGKYKSAVEPFLVDKMSKEAREQTEAMLADVWGEWKASVAADRRKPEAEIQAIADEKGLMTSKEALQAGLVDKLTAEDEVLDELKTLSGRRAEDREFPQIDLDTYAKTVVEARGRNRIAVVCVEGDIVGGEGLDGMAGGDRISRELRAVRLDSHVKAVVLRVNSPGGSVMASEVIRREVEITRRSKPVVVSMGHLAASGGYWVSASADHLFAEPNTLTGSIGAFGLYPNVKKLANEHGITWDSVQTSKLVMPGLTRPLDAAEMARFQAFVDDGYDTFLEKVAEGRKMTKAAVHEIGQGRVWSGRMAVKLGLVDELGGLQDAIRYAAKMARIENDYRVDPPEAPKSTLEKMMSVLGGGRRRLANTHAGPVDQLKGELDRQLRMLNAFSDPRGVYARMPFDLAIR